MFSDIISCSDVKREVAFNLTEHIFGDSYNGDISFVATLKALLYRRVHHGETYQFKNKLLTTTRELYTEEVLRRDVPPIGDNNCMTVCHFSGPGKFHIDGPDIAAKIFEESHPEYHHLERVDNFFEKSFKAITYISESRKSVVIFTGWLNEKKFHYLQTCIVACMPWFFPKGSLSKEELNVFYHMLHKDKEKYIEAIQCIFKRIENEYRVFVVCPKCGIRCLNPSEFDRHWICDSCGSVLSQNELQYKIIPKTELE